MPKVYSYRVSDLKILQSRQITEISDFSFKLGQGISFANVFKALFGKYSMDCYQWFFDEGCGLAIKFRTELENQKIWSVIAAKLDFIFGLFQDFAVSKQPLLFEILETLFYINSDLK